MSQKLISHQFIAMGGPCEVHIYTDMVDSGSSIFNLLEKEVRRLEVKYSRYSPSSLISQINRNEFASKTLDDETIGLLNYAAQSFELSDHMFDPTVGILREVWDYNANKLPMLSEVEQRLSSVGWQKLNWDGHQLGIPFGMELDFGGIVKEFAVDRLIVLLKQMGIDGLVNLAGDVAVSSSPTSEKTWKVSIIHPRLSNSVIADININQGALASSGDYERFMQVDGKRYCHILRPDTGYPAEGSFSSVSVLASNCLMAGTVSTVAMLKGLSEGLDWLNEMSLPYLAVDQFLNTYGTIEVSGK